MKIRTVVGLTGAAAASLAGIAGLAASPAGAAPAQHMSAAGLAVPLFGGFVPAKAFPNAKVTGNCPSWLFDSTNSFALEFLSGDAVLQRGFNLSDGFPNGGDVRGTAAFIENGSPVTDSGQTFIGSAHVWFGQNQNANGQSYVGEVATFSGTATDGSGSTLSFTVNPGGNTPANAKPNAGNGWGEQQLSCSFVSAG